MTYSEIHKKIYLIIHQKMRVFQPSASFTAHFYDDFDFAAWELKLLLNKVEEYFSIQLDQGLDRNLTTINQLVDVIFLEKQKQIAA